MTHAVTKVEKDGPGGITTTEQGELPYFMVPAERVQVYSSMPRERAADIIAAMQGADAATLTSRINKTFSVEHIIAHRVTILDQDTGELLEKDRVVLIGPSGDMVAGVSEGLKQSVQLLATFYGLPPWKPALLVEVQQVETRAGRRVFKLQPVKRASATVQK